jgi:hypothetical protein
MYAKQKNGVILKYPYLLEDLQMENPYTSFDNRFSLSEWYLKTEDAINTGAEIVEVIDALPPKINSYEFSIEKNKVPELVDGVWQLTWVVKETTTEEKEAFLITQQNATS